MTVYASALDMIGNTPMLALRRFDTGPCELFLKLEMQNPGGSIKDRIALYMIETAERQHGLTPASTLIEATAGNTGLGLALVAKLKGYRMLVVMPDKMGKEKITHLRAMGAEVITTRSDVEKGHPEYYQDLAARLASESPNAYYINQFANEANARTHEETTGPEILRQMDNRLDAFIYGIGSSGTFTGVGRYFKQHSPHTEMVLADPEGSVLAALVNEGKTVPAGKWLVEGIGEDFVPSICDLSLAHRAITVNDHDSLLMGRELLAKEGILAGSSTGTHLAAALQYCREQTTPKRVVTVACDSGNKYLSKMYDEEWMWNQGFIQRPLMGDLRDVISRSYEKHSTTIISPEEPIFTAHKHMMTYGISQVPVMDHNNIIGMVSELDIMQAVLRNNCYQKPVKEIMQKSFSRLPHTATLTEVAAALQHQRVVAIMNGTQFCGLITPIDMINYQKRRLISGSTE